MGLSHAMFLRTCSLTCNASTNRLHRVGVGADRAPPGRLLSERRGMVQTPPRDLDTLLYHTLASLRQLRSRALGSRPTYQPTTRRQPRQHHLDTRRCSISLIRGAPRGDLATTHSMTSSSCVCGRSLTPRTRDGGVRHPLRDGAGAHELPRQSGVPAL